MGLKGLHERRHQYERAKARARRKLKRRGWDHNDPVEVGKHASVRRKCSCWMCKRDEWEASRKGLRAEADKDDQLG